MATFKDKRDALYDETFYEQLVMFFKKHGKDIVNLLGLGAFFGFFIQIVYLIILDAIPFFSWNQVFSDGSVIMFMVIIFFLSFRWIWKMYDQYRDKAYVIQFFFFTILFIIIPHTSIKNLSLLILILPAFIGIIAPIFLYDKISKKNLDNVKKNAYLTLYLIIGLIAILVYYYPIYFKGMEVKIEDKKLPIIYMNDLYVFTEEGIYQKDNLVFFNQSQREIKRKKEEKREKIDLSQIALKPADYLIKLTDRKIYENNINFLLSTKLLHSEQFIYKETNKNKKTKRVKLKDYFYESYRFRYDLIDK